ncbi:MAG: hypothetical protein KY468_11035 [Armatimonadetes bacterium]|nr:hypothetical protein [Armatimonadota bacterium]
MIHLLSLGQFDYCYRCERWRPVREFYHRDENGERTRYMECSQCQVHPTLMDEEDTFHSQRQDGHSGE